MAVRPSSDRLNPDRIWPLHYFGEAYQVDDALLVSMKAALGRVARDFPQDFRRLAHELLPSTSETVQLLLMSAYAAAGQSFADAAEHLLSKPACFEVGYWNGGSHWAARQLLEAITGYCSEENLRRLEDFILNYYPVTERGAGAIFGRAQQVLLDGIDANRISARVRERQQQLERKFPVHSTGPRPVVFHEVRSPVPERAIEHMSDEQWLQAVAKYSGDQMNATATGFTGGVHELGQLLETQARREPERFALLSDRFPPGTNSGYFSAVLRALSGSGIPTDLHLRVWRACHHLPRRPCGHSLPDAIASVSDRPLPEEALAIVAWYATEDPSPMTDTWDDDSRYQGRWPLGERIATEGINSVRGRATRAMGQLILADASRLNFFSSTLERIASDQSLAVRVCLTWTLSCAAIHNEELATMVFLSAAEKSDMLLAGTWAEDFVWRVARRQFTRVSALLERCLTSSTPAVQTAAARQVCVVALGSSQGSGLVEQVIQGAPPLRKGAAEIFAATVADSALRPLCEQRLAELFNDPEADVRSAASSCFRHFNGSALDGAETLIASFTDSQAFLDHYAELLHAIQRSSARLPAATCNACERFIDIAGMDAGDIRTAAAADAHIVSQLIIRLYSQASDAQLKSRCLEIIDKMSAMKAYGIAEALSQYER